MIKKILPVFLYRNILLLKKEKCHKNYTRNEDIYHYICAFMTKVMNILSENLKSNLHK